MTRIEILDKAKADIVEVLSKRCVKDCYAIEYYSDLTRTANCIIVRVMNERSTIAYKDRSNDSKKYITEYAEPPDYIIEVIPIRQIDGVIIGSDKRGPRVMVNGEIEVNIMEIVPMNQSLFAIEEIQEVLKRFCVQFGEAKPKEEKTGPTVIPKQ